MDGSLNASLLWTSICREPHPVLTHPTFPIQAHTSIRSLFIRNWCFQNNSRWSVSTLSMSGLWKHFRYECNNTTSRSAHLKHFCGIHCGIMQCFVFVGGSFWAVHIHTTRMLKPCKKVLGCVVPLSAFRWSAGAPASFCQFANILMSCLNLLLPPGWM